MANNVNLNVKGVDEEDKRRAIYVLNSRGTDLSKAIREFIHEVAKEFDDMSR